MSKVYENLQAQLSPCSKDNISLEAALIAYENLSSDYIKHKLEDSYVHKVELIRVKTAMVKGDYTLAMAMLEELTQ